ncbi:MAG: ribonuclease H-like domain-containing protein [Patescibacteria group bacterium]|nr:ribonuclease H-like domain-containing protein [Patescibacteria group bacterium]
MDKIVFDIETKNSFADVGGQENLKRLDVSVIGVYSYADDSYICFNEHELEKAGKLLQNAKMLIGFSSKRFDVPVLEKYFPFNLAAIPHFDILEEIEKKMSRRIGLGMLAEANLGMKKSAHGLEAIDFYRNGEIEKLKNYCLQDVKITKEIFELIKKQGFLWFPDRNSVKMLKVELQVPKEENSHPQLI